MKDKLFKFASNVNISYIIKFHEFIMDELLRKEQELSDAIANFEGDRKLKVNLLVEKDLYTTTYKHHLLNNTFLMLYSHLEEWLYNIWKAYGAGINLNTKKRGSISRFSPVLREVLNMDLSSNGKWQFLIEAEKVRNCLLHANARIDLSTNIDDLRKILNNRKDLLSESQSRLNLTQSYLEEFFACIQSIIMRVESTQKT